MTATTAQAPTATRSTAERRADVIFVGGLPGAGKSTAIRAVAPDAVAVLVLDPERVRDGLARVTPTALPYRWLRPIVHLAHYLAVVAALLLGPGLMLTLTGRGRLLIHDPATRPRRARALARLARARGWSSLALYLDVPAPVALTGQQERGRVVRAAAFTRHVDRWVPLREALRTDPQDVSGADRVRVVCRDEAVTVLRRELLAGMAP